MPLNYFHRYLVWQLSGLAYSLDPLDNSTTAQNVSSSKWNFYFIPPFFIVLTWSIYGNILLPWFAGVPLTWASLSTSPALLFRQMYPPVMWPQTNFALSIAAFGALSIYVSFWRHPWTLPRYVLVWNPERDRPLLRIGSSVLSPGASLKILSVHRRIRKVSFVGFIGASIIVSLFVYTTTFLNGYYSLTNGHYLLVLFLMFPALKVMLYALFGLPTFLILASVCTQIRQKDLISQMSALNDKVRRLKTGKPERSQAGMASFRHQNRHLNRSLLSIVSQLEAYATYWTPALSLLFLILATLQTYLAYPVFFTDGMFFLQKITFLFFFINIDVTLFLLIDVCARVVQLNRQIEVLNGGFYLLMARKGAFKGKNICQQLKCEALATSGRLRPYAFHLFDNYRITLRTFYMVFANIALFSLLVFKHSG